MSSPAEEASALPDMSVVIVNMNGARWMEPCLEGVRVAAEGKDVEVILVDNDSGSETKQLLSPSIW